MSAEMTTAGSYAAMRKTYDALGTAMTVVVAVTGVLCLIVAIVTRLSAKQEYTVFGHPVLTVLSGSMSPAIHTGDLIIDHPVTSTEAAAKLHVGQIITFRSAESSTMVLTHRIHGVQRENGAVVGYITKGDANNAPDATPVPVGNVIGVFDHKVPKGGYILNALHKPQVLGFLVASPLLWLLSGSLLAYARKPEEVEES